MNLDEILAVRDQHPITEVLQRFGVYPPQRWNGASDYMINCPTPNHEDATPSCIVHPQTDRYFCFGCGARGDVLQLVQDVRGRAPLHEVASFLGGSGVLGGAPRLSATPAASHASANERTSRDRVLQINEEAWRALTSPQAAGIARRYLSRRGIDIPVLQAQTAAPLAGYTPAQRDGLVNHLREAGYSDAEVVDAGWALCVDNRLVDRFHRRVMFPVTDAAGAVLGAIGRDVSGIAQRRYLNTPRTIAYVKSKQLYLPMRGASWPATVMLCEGPADALAMSVVATVGQLPVAAAATAGTALSETHALLLSKGGVRAAVICADADQAGDAASGGWYRTLRAAGLNVSRLRPPTGLDPAAWVSTCSGEVSGALARVISI